jgi:hypothetical protein
MQNKEYKTKKFLKEQAETTEIGVAENNIPIVACWRINFSQVGFFCRYCKQVHRHGFANGNPDGHRVAHCTEDSPFERKGYYLVCQDNVQEQSQ